MWLQKVCENEMKKKDEIYDDEHGRMDTDDIGYSSDKCDKCTLYWRSVAMMAFRVAVVTIGGGGDNTKLLLRRYK